MSYILEALKKLEKDKARSRKELDPIRQLVRLDYASAEPSRGMRGWHKLAISICVGVLLISATYWTTRRMFLSNLHDLVGPATKGRHVVLDEAQNPSGVQSQKEENARALPLALQDNATLLPRRESLSKPPSGEETGREGHQEVSPPEPSPPRNEYHSDVDQPNDSVGEPLKLDDDQVDELPTANMQRTVKSERRSRAGERTYAAQTPPNFPALKISAVAWSPDSVKRFAVVNLRSVHEGDSIEGAVVSEIQLDGVIFKWQGNEYRLLMSRH